MRATLARLPSTSHGTPGMLSVAGKWFSHTLELPWRDNKPLISCVPPGVYRVDWLPSVAFGHAYRLAGVPGRIAILFHPGTVAGDTTLGLRTDSLGCILLGDFLGTLNGQRAVLSSLPAINRLAALLDRQSFSLSIIGGG